MCFERIPSRAITCPHLKGTPGGAYCEAGSEFVKNIQDVSIRFCMSRHFESCHVYFLAFRQELLLREASQAQATA